MCKNCKGETTCFDNGGEIKKGFISCYGFQYLVPIEECNKQCKRYITEEEKTEQLEEESETIDDYINRMIKDGYWNKDFEPIKCEYCESENIENDNFLGEGFNEPCGTTTEYDKVCKDCGKIIEHWSYGNWEI